ncbi:UDP-glucose 4-epimerase [Pseudovibrio axinellae]|uniref:UDP-glucose 4-epimerase n=1 Tax=Pseudovibrio axinellae TaxID=989403 RepID=A0A165T348_9HYPH|nr:NAD-dependent epimerase/dehydratase family protein [Pseudovibrio axinellae]KZL05358.1 UDP-glucose 4-epimerase [Pseudovibrio axinellae]SER36577.1 UDP-glucose 4-epimerase [Pseudovibrio axinellae]
MLKRVLITGGCGFIGSNLIKALTDANFCEEIVVLDNEVTGSSDSLKSFPHRFIRGDIRDLDVVEEAARDAEAIVHLAADTRVLDSIENPTYNFDVNVKGTMNVLEAMRQEGVRYLINASTGGAIVGNAHPPVHEAMPVRPASAYGASKAAAEAYCSAYSQSYGLVATSLRFSNVYGPLSLHKGSVVAAFMKNILNGKPCRIYGDGSQTRDFIFTEDLCQGIIAALKYRQNGVFQLGSGRPTSVNELIILLKAGLKQREGFEVTYHDFRVGEVQHNFTDISKAMKELRFRPETNLSDGLMATWDYFEKNQELFVVNDVDEELQNAG